MQTRTTAHAQAHSRQAQRPGRKWERGRLSLSAPRRQQSWQAGYGGPVVIFDRHHGAGSATFPPIWPPCSTCTPGTTPLYMQTRKALSDLRTLPTQFPPWDSTAGCYRARVLSVKYIHRFDKLRNPHLSIRDSSLVKKSLQLYYPFGRTIGYR